MTLRKFEALWDEHLLFKEEGQEDSSPDKPKSFMNDNEEVGLDHFKGL